MQMKLFVHTLNSLLIQQIAFSKTVESLFLYDNHWIQY